MRYLEYDPRFNHPSDKFGPLLAMNVGSVFGATGLTVMLLPMLGLRTLRNHKVLTLRIGQTILMLGPPSGLCYRHTSNHADATSCNSGSVLYCTALRPVVSSGRENVSQLRTRTALKPTSSPDQPELNYFQDRRKHNQLHLLWRKDNKIVPVLIWNGPIVVFDKRVIELSQSFR